MNGMLGKLNLFVEEEEEGAVEGLTQSRPQGSDETAATQEMPSQMKRKSNGKKQEEARVGEEELQQYLTIKVQPASNPPQTTRPLHCQCLTAKWEQ